MSRSSSIPIILCLVLALCGCGRLASADPTASPLRPKTLAFVQDGLHNCGTVAMLISWAGTHSREAADLVRRQPGGGYLVSFPGDKPVRVTTGDLAAARKARLALAEQGDEWARVVLTAFVKWKCQPKRLDFRVTDWIYAGEIAFCLTGGNTGNFEIKQETQDRKGRIRVGPPVSLYALKQKLSALRGKAVVAYTNRRVHIWAVTDYDAHRSRLLVRNPRLRSCEWIPVSEFRRRFQLLVYAES